MATGIPLGQKPEGVLGLTLSAATSGIMIMFLMMRDYQEVVGRRDRQDQALDVNLLCDFLRREFNKVHTRKPFLTGLLRVGMQRAEARR